MNELLVQFTISLGRLLDSIKTARNPNFEKGPAISSAEKKEIYDAFHELENKILKVFNRKELNDNFINYNPTLLLIVLFFVKSDRFPEPTNQIIKIFFYGIFLCFPAYYLNF